MFRFDLTVIPLSITMARGKGHIAQDAPKG